MIDKLFEMKTFQAVAEAGGFTAAASALGISQSAVSRVVLRLELRLGTALLHRSTRRVRLTDEGQIFLQACRRLLEDVAEAEQSITSDKQPVGTLRVNAAVLWGLDPLVGLLPEFTARYPKIGVHLSLTDRDVDLIEEKVDVAIRVGQLADSSLIARKIGEMHRVIVASPAYLAERGRPKTPDDLPNHDCLLWDEEHDDLNRWSFEMNGAFRRINVRGRIISNNAQALYQLALTGAGIFRMLDYRARPYIRSGELVQLFGRSHHDKASPVNALYLRTNMAKPRIRAFVDFLIEKCAPDPHNDMKPKTSSQARPT